MRDVDVSAEEQAKRILDMVGEAVFKNLAMRVLDTLLLFGLRVVLCRF